MPIRTQRTRRVTVASMLLVAGACHRPLSRVSPAPSPTPAAPLRVVNAASLRPLALNDLAEAASHADVVIVGEEHTDPETHRVEFALLQAIGERRGAVILSLEMFERDAQPSLDAYLAGRLSEAEFLAQTHPWPRYATDYRPMVELAKARGWPVIASNVPRAIASAIGRGGLGALDSLAATDRAFAARDILCPDDDYRRRFFDEMKGHASGAAAPSPGDTLPTAVAQRFYLAQCVKDETMGESIASARQRAGDGVIIVHYNGSFHSDFGAGTAERLRRRAPGVRTVVITAIPVEDPIAGVVKDAKRADYVVFTRTVAKSTKPR